MGVKTTLHINNRTHELPVDSRVTLLDALRDVLDEKFGDQVCHAATI